MRRIVSVLCALGLAVGMSGLTASASEAADLPVPVGAGPQVAVRQPVPGMLTQVRTGRHAGYDRLVFQIAGELPGWDVRYVGTVHADPSGQPVRVAGNAVLRVVLTGVIGHDANGTPTAGATRTPRLPALTQVKAAGDLEAVVTFAVGVSDRLDFRVFGLTNPTRVVVDIAHPISQPYTADATQFWAPTGGGGDFTLGTIRTGGHPAFDRIVLDLPGSPVKPNIGVSYASPMYGYPANTVLVALWTFTHAGVAESAIASYHGPRTIQVGLPNVRTVTVTGLNTGQLNVLISTALAHGYRALMVPGNGVMRLVVDIAH